MTYRHLINTLGDSHDPTQLSEVWDHDAYRAASHISSGGCVVDIGANVGSFSIWAAAQGASRVIAVEPFEENILQLHLNLSQTGLEEVVTVLPVAAAATTGFCTVIPGGPVGTAERSTGTHTFIGEGECPSMSLADIISDLTLVDVMKVDCEGDEYDIFSTASIEVMQKIRYLCLEFHVWREPGSVPVEGIGERNGIMPDGGVSKLLAILSRTHDVTVQGDICAGGYIFGSLK